MMVKQSRKARRTAAKSSSASTTTNGNGGDGGSGGGNTATTSSSSSISFSYFFFGIGGDDNNNKMLSSRTLTMIMLMLLPLPFLIGICFGGTEFFFQEIKVKSFSKEYSPKLINNNYTTSTTAATTSASTIHQYDLLQQHQNSRIKTSSTTRISPSLIEKAIEFVDNRQEEWGMEYQHNHWKLRGIGYLYTHHQIILAAQVVDSKGNPTTTSSLRMGKNSIQIYNVHPNAANNTQHNNNCHLLTLWVRVNGPEIISGKPYAVVPSQQDGASPCYWQFDFFIALPGQYTIDNPKMIFWNGIASVRLYDIQFGRDSANLGLLAENTQCKIVHATNTLPAAQLEEAPQQTSLIGFKLYTPIQSCCEMCRRFQPHCNYWATPPKLLPKPTQFQNGCELYYGPKTPTDQIPTSKQMNGIVKYQQAQLDYELRKQQQEQADAQEHANLVAQMAANNAAAQAQADAHAQAQANAQAQADANAQATLNANAQLQANLAAQAAMDQQAQQAQQQPITPPSQRQRQLQQQQQQQQSIISPEELAAQATVKAAMEQHHANTYGRRSLRYGNGQQQYHRHLEGVNEAWGSPYSDNPHDVGYFVGCGWSFMFTLDFPCISGDLDDAVYMEQNEFIVDEDGGSTSATAEQVATETHNEKKSTGINSLFKLPKAKNKKQQQQEQQTTTENLPTTIPPNGDLPLCTVYDESILNRPNITSTGVVGRWVREGVSTTQDEGEDECPPYEELVMPTGKVSRPYPNHPKCWHRSDMTHLNKQCKEMNCDKIKPKSKYLSSSLQQEMDFYAIWKNYHCDYYLYTDDQLSECVQKKGITQIVTKGASISGMLKDYLEARIHPNITIAMSKSSSQQPQAGGGGKTVVINTLKWPHLLWRRSQDKWIEELQKELPNEEEAYWVSPMFTTSEREPYVQLERGLQLIKIAEPIIKAKGYHMINMFDPSAAMTYDTAGQADGLHIIGPPMKYAIDRIFHHMCSDIVEGTRA